MILKFILIFFILKFINIIYKFIDIIYKFIDIIYKFINLIFKFINIINFLIFNLFISKFINNSDGRVLKFCQ